MRLFQLLVVFLTENYFLKNEESACGIGVKTQLNQTFSHTLQKIINIQQCAV